MSSHFGNLAILTLSFSALALGVPTFALGAGTPQDRIPSTIASEDAEKAEAALKVEYRDLILVKGADDEDYLAKTATGQTRQTPRWSYAKADGTSEEAEETIHSIILTAYKALRANDAKYSNEIKDEQERPYSPETYSKIKALVDDRSKKEMQIVEHAIIQLKEGLTQEDFERLERDLRLIRRIRN